MPATGTYRLAASCNVGLTAAQSVSLGASVDPSLDLQVNSSTFATSRVAIMNVNVPLVLSLRTVVEGPVALDTVVDLTAGDVATFAYVPDGLSLSVALRNCQFSATPLDA